MANVRHHTNEFFELLRIINRCQNHHWLVVSPPLKNMKVRLDHHPNYLENHKIHVPI
jgi:hypothetical protein